MVAFCQSFIKVMMTMMTTMMVLILYKILSLLTLRFGSSSSSFDDSNLDWHTCLLNIQDGAKIGADGQLSQKVPLYSCL